MWPFSRTEPGATMYPAPQKIESDSQELSPEDQAIYNELVNKLRSINLPDDQQRISPEDQEKIDSGVRSLIHMGVPSVHLAYAFHEVEQAFPDKAQIWKREMAGKLAMLLKNKHRQN